MFNRRFKSNLQGSENSNLTLTLPENKQEGLLPNSFYETSKTTEQDERKYEKGKVKANLTLKQRHVNNNQYICKQNQSVDVLEKIILCVGIWGFSQ